jgi:FMN phosphatase YigB (HAD superfamily)
MTENKNVLFVDFNGVLSYKPFWFYLSEESHEHHRYWNLIQDYLFKNNIEIVKKWMVGDYTSEEIHNLLESNLDIAYDKLYPIFVETCKNIDISEPILDQVRMLKNKYYTVLITDNMDCFDRYTKPNNPKMLEAFDQIDTSYNLKALKASNNGKYFVDTVKTINSFIEQSILIDDSSKNCALFESLGGRTYNVTGEAQVVEALKMLGK